MHKRKILIVIADLGEEEKARKSEFDTSLDEYSSERKLAEKNPEFTLMKLDGQYYFEPEKFKEKIKSYTPTCILNRFEGWSDDSTQEIVFARILEDLGIPFTGNPPAALNLCLDKWNAKEVLRKAGVPVPLGKRIDASTGIDHEGLRFPLFLKPCLEDASIGIDELSLVRDEKEFIHSVSVKLKSFPRGILAEEFISGKEYTMGMIGNSPYEILGLSVLDHAGHGLIPYITYDSKWMSNTDVYKKIMPSLDEAISENTRQKIEDIASRTAEAFGCKGYFRIDMRERDGEIYVLDVNPNPDISEDSGFMRQAFKKGYTYESMLYKLVELAEERFRGME